MGDDYQVRKDIDKVLRDIYDYNEGLKVPLFRENSPLKYIGVNQDDEGQLTDKGTLDAIFEYYGLLDVDEKLQNIVVGEISFDGVGFVSETELNTILSSYVTSDYANTHYAEKSHTHSQYISRSEAYNLDINLSTLELVDYETNNEGVICFENLSSNYIEKSNTTGFVKNDGSIDTTQYLSSLPSHNHDNRYYTESEINTALNAKQNTLVSGTNIKTINNQSLLGNGNIEIQSSSGGGSVIGTGSFSINSNGHLIVELPNAVDNPYFIDSNGHLIYDTSNTHNGS